MPVVPHAKPGRAMWMRSQPRRLVIALALLGAAIGTAAVLLAQPSSNPERMLEIELRASAGTMAQVYWSPGRDFAEERSTSVPFTAPSEALQRLRFPLPPTNVQWLRIDPSDAPADVLIGKVQVVDSSGQVQANLNPDDFKPASDIASITRMGDVTRITTTPQAADPFLTTSFACVDRASPLSVVTPSGLVLVSGAIITLLLAGAAILGRAVFATATSATRWTSAALLTALFVFIFATKLLLMSQNPVTVPYWDQWDAEGLSLYVPFNECTLSWQQMFALHNEHRIFFTRLLALDLLVLNGQWDPRIQQLANAVMHAFTGVLMAATLWLASGRRRLWLLVLVCGVVFASPFAWDNTLMGFQSAFYFLLLFSVLALWLTTSYQAGSVPWFLGFACAACALFTSAGGLITTAVILGVAVLKLANDRREWRAFLITMVCAAGVLWLGIRTASPPIPEHEFLKAHTVAELLGALARNLAWPWINYPPLALLMWLPLCLLLLTLAWRRGKTTEFDRLVLGLGAWVAINALAIAYGRGAGAGRPASRYMDFLSLGFVANATALLAVIDLAASRAVVWRVAVGALAGWLIFATLGVERLTERMLIDLQDWRRYSAAHETIVRRFVLGDDVAMLASKRGPVAIPYPSGYTLAGMLRDPYLRRILPARVRPPLHVEPKVTATAGFVTGGRSVRGIPTDPLQRAWLSLTGEGRKSRGRFTSEHIVCQSGGRLRFQVSGYLGWEHNSLAIKNLRTGETAPISPATVAKEDWTEVLVTCPADLFEIVAIDDAPDSWFGFREPIEVARGSLAAEWLINRAGMLR